MIRTFSALQSAYAERQNTLLHVVQLIVVRQHAFFTDPIKFAPADYQGEVDKQVTSLTKWAESYFNENNFELTHNKLLTTYMRTAGLNQYYLDEAVKQIQNGAEFKSPEVWSDAVLALTASGVDIRNIYGRNLWDEAEEFISDLLPDRSE